MTNEFNWIFSGLSGQAEARNRIHRGMSAD